MPLFVMIGHDGPNGATLRDEHRTEHLDYITRQYSQGRIAFAGPIRNDQGDKSVGAVIVYDTSDLASVKLLVDSDPYVSAGVFERITVAPFKRAFPPPS